jgi:hypothetical protein
MQRKIKFITITLLLLLLSINSVFAECNIERPNWASKRGYYNTRHYILYRDGINVIRKKNGYVISGKWVCFYSNKIITIKKNAEIDHKLPWAFYKRNAPNCDRAIEFYNDEDNLVIADHKVNHSKSDKIYNTTQKSNCNICKKYKLNNCDLIC